MDKNAKTGKSSSTLKHILRGASIFLSRSPDIVKSSEASQSRSSRRCRLRRATPGVATPPRKNPDSESESEPNSPRVSCAGKVQKKKKKAKRSKSCDEEDPGRKEWIWERNKRKTSMEIESTENGAQGSGSGETAPCLNKMKRFASGRSSSLSNLVF